MTENTQHAPQQTGEEEFPKTEWSGGGGLIAMLAFLAFGTVAIIYLVHNGFWWW